MNTETMMILAENKKMYAEKINFHYVIQEIIKTCKKKKGTNLKKALQMLTENDKKEIKNILKEFKVKY